LAYGRGLSSLALPSIATGALGYPLQEAAPIAVAAVIDQLSELEAAFRVRFVLFGPATFEAYVAATGSPLENDPARRRIRQIR